MSFMLKIPIIEKPVQWFAATQWTGFYMKGTSIIVNESFAKYYFLNEYLNVF